MNTIHVQVITPTGIVYDSSADQVSITTETGEITVLPNHIPLIAPIVPGELRISKDGEVIPFAVDRGVVEVSDNNSVSILVEHSDRAFDIDEAEITAAIERATAAMADKSNVLDVDFARFQAMMERDMNKLRVAQKWRK